jgi:glycosyltransferase involved in cell wall biosynthesis
MRPLIEAVDRVLERRRPAAALLWNGAEFLAFARDGFPRAVADRIDCGALEWLRAVRHTPWVLGRALRYARYERRVVRSLDATIVAGHADAHALQRVSGTRRVVLIPNGVHAEPSPRFDAESVRPTVAFTGTLSYYANIDAVRHFVRRMWPAIQREVPSARLLVVGRNPRRRILALRDVPGVEVRADVADMAAALQEAWVAVAPMRRGTGVKNKVLEAWAAGRAVVMSPLAANGLRLDDRMHELVAADTKAFCEQVVRLLRDGPRRHAYGNAAHTLVTRRHSWRESGQAVSRLLEGGGRTQSGDAGD